MKYFNFYKRKSKLPGFCREKWKFTSLRIGKKLYVGFGVMISLMAAVLGYAYHNFSVESKSVIDNIHTYEVLNETNAILISLVDMETGVRGFVLTGKDEFLSPYKIGREEYQKHISKIKELTTSSAQLERLRFLQEKTQNWEARELTPLLFMQSQAGNEQSKRDTMIRHIQTGFGKKDMDEMRKTLADFDNEERMNLEKRSHELQDMESFTRRAMILGGLVSTAAGILFAFFITGAITKPVNILDRELHKLVLNGGDLTQIIHVDSKDEIGDLAQTINQFLADIRQIMVQVLASSENVAASAQQLTASSQQSAEAANQVVAVINDIASDTRNQADEVTAVSAVMEQMSTKIKQVAENSHEVTILSDKTSVAAQNGGQAIEKAIYQMGSIDETVMYSSKVVTKLGESSKEIGQIVAAISGIAGQTNLLALNAAIEAARAGEQGQGFAVVAEEVRKLANQSQEAAKKISGLIDQIKKDADNAVIAMSNGIEESKTGIEVVHTAGVAFREIITLVTDVSGQIREISSSIQHIASGSQQIVSSVHGIQILSKEAANHTETISAASEEQSASMQEIAISSQELAKLAEQLSNAVNKFSV
jgi:methyl-accepting chemotaxis protein